MARKAKEVETKPEDKKPVDARRDPSTPVEPAEKGASENFDQYRERH